MKTCGRICFWSALLLLPMSAVQAQAPAGKAELASIIAAIDEAKASLNASRQARSTLSKDIEAQERDILAVQRTISQVGRNLQNQRSRLDSLQTESGELETRRTSQQALIAAYLEEAWKQGDQPRLKLLLNQEDLPLAARMLRYHQEFARARATVVDAYSATLTRLDLVKTDIATTLGQLEIQQETLSRQERALKTSQLARQQALASLDADVSNRSAELDRLEMERIEIEVLLEELARSVNELALEGSDDPFASRKGKLEWPVKGRVTQPFGTKHELGDLTWEGLTIAAPAGADIQAVHHGRVIFADWFGNSGLLLIIDHGDGYMSLYAHNQELYRTVGEWVSSGELIAAVGDTGGQRQTGLYFEVRLNGTAQNPSSWLSSPD